MEEKKQYRKNPGYGAGKNGTGNTGRYDYRKKDGTERTDGGEKPRASFRDGVPQTDPDQLVIGRNAVSELLKSGRDIDKLWVKKGERVGSLIQIVGEAIGRGIPVAEVEASKLDAMAGGLPHQGVIASAALKQYITVEEMVEAAKASGEKPLILIADCVEDPQNLGAMIRVAECCGAHGVILPKRHAVGLTGVVGKASAGALEHVPVAKVPNLAQTVDYLKKEGFWIFAAEAGGQTYYECDMNCAAAIILGSEGNGVSRLLLDKSDAIVSIPMYGRINSLNVSCATAVILNEAARQQRTGTK